MPRPALASATAAALLALTFGWAASGVLQDRALERARQVAEAVGGKWLQTSADGLRVTLAGEAPSAAVAEELREALDAAGGLVTFDDRISIVQTAQAPSPAIGAISGSGTAYQLSILRDTSGVLVTGLAPDPIKRADLAQALRRVPRLGDVRVVAEAGASGAVDHWAAIAQTAVAAAAALDHGRVQVEPNRLQILGLPGDGREDHILELANALDEIGVTVEVDLASARAPLAASVLEVTVGPSGRTNIDVCAPPDAATARLIEATSTPRSASSASCEAAFEIASDAGSRAWGQLAAEAIRELRRLGGGSLRVADGQAILTPDSPVAPDAGERLATRLRSSAPPEVAVYLQTPPASPPPDGARLARATSWMRARLTPDLLTLTGAAPDEATRAAVRSYAAAAFGSERVHDGLAVSDRPSGAPGWRAATLAAIDALDRLSTGEAVVYDGQISVDGVALSGSSAGAADRALDAADGWQGSTRITVDLPARAETTRFPPEICVERLRMVVAEAPIAFSPSSADIDVGSGSVLDQLAAILRRCDEARIEISGHTDSQGSTDYNRRLSLERARAVRQALVARGAPDQHLVAEGYGEDVPVANNETEEGRAMNRRIAFELVAEPDSEDANATTNEKAGTEALR